MGKQRPKKQQERPTNVNSRDWDAVCKSLVEKGILPPTVLDRGMPKEYGQGRQAS